MRILSAFFIVLAFVAFMPMAVYAQTQTTSPAALSKIKKVPVYNEMTDADFVAKTQQFKDTPMDDSYLSYEIRLPKDWKKLTIGNETEEVLPEGQFVFSKGMKQMRRDFLAKEAKALESQSSITGKEGTPKPEEDSNAMNSKVLGVVAKYYGPVEVNAYPNVLTIDAQDLKFDISAKNWFLNFILTNGYTLEGLEVINDRRVEALYVLLDGGVSYVIRAVAEINGKRMILVRMSIPESEWMQKRGMQEKVLRSFKFVTPETVKIGASRTYSFLTFLRFDYPVYWRLAAPMISTLDSMDASLLMSMDEKTLEGEINVHVVSVDAEDTTMQKEVKVLTDQLGERGFLLGDMLEDIDYFKVPSQVFFHKTQAYKVLSKQKRAIDYEYWVAIMREERYTYYLSLLTISRSSDFFTWAKNTEAFQEVVETMRP